MGFYEDIQSLIARGREWINDLEKLTSEHASTLPSTGPVNPPTDVNPPAPGPTAAPPAPADIEDASERTSKVVEPPTLEGLSTSDTLTVPSTSVTGDTTNA
jgi:hypothetical protein